MEPASTSAEARRVQLHQLMDSLPPSDVIQAVMQHLARRSSLSGSPLAMLQNGYLDFLKAQHSPSRERNGTSSTLQERDSPTTKRHNNSRSPSGKRRGHSGGTDDEGEAVYVMNSSKEYLRAVHMELLALQENYRQLAAQAIAKDKKIVHLMTELGTAQEQLEVLQRGITSSHVVHASEVDDADLLREAQILNGRLAEDIAALEDNIDVGASVHVDELYSAIQMLTREKEALLNRNALFAKCVLEADDTVKELKVEVARLRASNESYEHSVSRLSREVNQLKFDAEAV